MQFGAWSLFIMGRLYVQLNYLELHASFDQAFALHLRWELKHIHESSGSWLARLRNLRRVSGKSEVFSPFLPILSQVVIIDDQRLRLLWPLLLLNPSFVNAAWQHLFNVKRHLVHVLGGGMSCMWQEGSVQPRVPSGPASPHNRYSNPHLDRLLLWRSKCCRGRPGPASLTGLKLNQLRS